jgi:hypothetical protein
MDRSLSPTKTKHAPRTHKSTQLTPIVKILGDNQVEVSNGELSHKNDDYLFVEEFDSDHDRKFLDEVVRPYFANIFSDLAQRRMTPKKAGETEGEYMDKVAFFEYANLPGIINDRFYSTFDGSKEGRILRQAFVEGFARVYLAPLEDKMKLTFNM